jgi:hypothetical protein
MEKYVKIECIFKKTKHQTTRRNATMGNEAIMMKRKVSGRERLYMRPASHKVNLAIPTTKEIKDQMDKKTDVEFDFVEYFPGNHEGFVWRIRQGMNKENYHSFIYLFARYAMDYYNPTNSVAWQFEHNVRKVQNKLNNANIALSGAEKMALNYMLTEMPDQPRGTREMFLKEIVKDLERQYGIYDGPEEE